MEKLSTFLDLAEKAAMYWSLDIKDIFFSVRSSQPTPDEEDAVLYNPEMLVREELFPWETQTLSFITPKVYVLLSNFETLEQKLDNSIDDGSDDEDLKKLPPPKSKKKIEEENVAEELKARVKQNSVFYIVQTVVYLVLMLLWLTSVMSAKDNLAYNYMNQQVLADTTGVRKAFDETYSTYITDLQRNSAFFRIKQTEDIIAFIASLEYLIYYVGYSTGSELATIASFNRIFPYLQLRQLRSEVDDCDFAEFDIDALCARSLSSGILTSDIEVNGYTVEYKEGDTRSKGIRAVNYIYPLSGNVIEVPCLNYTAYMLSSATLNEIDWVTKNTRYMALTMNIYNPSLHAYTSIVFSFVFDQEQNVTPQYSISTYYYKFYGPGEVAITVLLLLCSVAMMLIIVRDMFVHPEENRFMSNRKTKATPRSPEEIRKDLTEWDEYLNLSLCRRCHRPDPLSSIILVSSLGIISLVIVHIVWYFSVLQPDFDVSDTDYVDLVFATQVYDTIVVFQGVVTILLCFGVLKYSKYWISTMAIMTRMIIVKIERFFGFIMASFLGIIGFAMYFYGVLGPYEYRACIDYLALSGMVRFFVGRWFTTEAFADFISVWFLILPFFAFLYFKMTILLLSVINLQHQFMKSTVEVSSRLHSEHLKSLKAVS
jgi:hypothetical protein